MTTLISISSSCKDMLLIEDARIAAKMNGYRSFSEMVREALQIITEEPETAKRIRYYRRTQEK